LPALPTLRVDGRDAGWDGGPRGSDHGPVDEAPMIVRKVDHVFVPLAAPEATFGFLTETLGLPVAWPFTEYGPFASGGVSLGSIHLEVVRSSDPLPCFVARDPARVQGIAFEPPPIDDALLAELDRRGIPHSSPAPFPGTGHGTTGLLWRLLHRL